MQHSKVTINFNINININNNLYTTVHCSKLHYIIAYLYEVEAEACTIRHTRYDSTVEELQIVFQRSEDMEMC